MTILHCLYQQLKDCGGGFGWRHASGEPLRGHGVLLGLWNPSRFAAGVCGATSSLSRPAGRRAFIGVRSSKPPCGAAGVYWGPVLQAALRGGGGLLGSGPSSRPAGRRGFIGVRSFKPPWRPEGRGWRWSIRPAQAVPAEEVLRLGRRNGGAAAAGDAALRMALMSLATPFMVLPKSPYFLSRRPK
jgi:hypothetical protein